MVLELIYTLPAIFIALSFHEFAHAWAAYKMGDDTAKWLGRLTIDPLAHIDPIGLLCLLITRRFGWAKPVPINPSKFKDYKKGTMIVSLAGPMMNFLIAFVSYFIFVLLITRFNVNNTVILTVIANIYGVNIGIGIFNLIPLPPLDGSKILAGFLPGNVYQKFYEIEKYTQFIMLILVFTNSINFILNPIYTGVENVIYTIVNFIL